jgi:hypothetical protein
MPIIQREVRRRGPVGWVFKVLFIAFNVVMAIWLVSYWGTVGGQISSATSDAAKAGGALGATLGTTMLLLLWVLGTIILGALTFFTRGRAVLITEERP